ncbi:MAG: DUF3794 domain-containing protein [Oscillospiraceae bacterium]|jgi:hypothetical protein|nr:DUF3794 domain-containing protein [Oscillospiraceae bacterium]
MEFELDRTQINGFDALLDTTLRTEETLEMIVPDACPDILRVVETEGKVLLHRRETVEGRVELTGSIRGMVLYLPDGEEGVRHLDINIPFTCAADNAAIAPGCSVVASARCCRADTRTINPRKILIRAEAAVDVTVFAPRMETICSQVLEASEQRVEQLTETREVYLTACVQEKPFPFSEDVTLSASKPAAVELLKNRVTLSRGESKIIGNKLIFKGSANVSLLYRGQDNGAYTATAELPFSQIMEISGVAEDAECDMTLALSGADCALNMEDDGRTVSVTLEVLAQAVVRETRVLQVLTDAYSTREPLEVELAQCPMDTRLDRGVRSQNVREVWEIPTPVRELVDCSMTVGQLTRSQEGERLVLTAQVELQILYRDEEGSLFSVQHPMTVPCALELPEGCRSFCQCEGVGDVYAAPAPGGVEVRFALDFRYCALERRTLAALSGLHPGEAPEEGGAHPSLVLRMLGRGERLWDLAKTYGTTIADIISANELEDEAAAGERLLLIPRRR